MANIRIKYSVNTPLNPGTWLPTEMYDWLVSHVGNHNQGWFLYCREVNESYDNDGFESVIVAISTKYKDEALLFKLKFGGL